MASKQSADTLSMLVEQSGDGMLVVDVAGRVRFANAAAAALLRKESHELLGYQFGYPAVSDEAVEILIAPKGSEPSVVELRAVSLDWEGDKALLVNLRDITAHKRQEQRLTQQSATLRAVRDVHELILREKNSHALLRGACAALVEERYYDAATIALRARAEHSEWIASSSAHGAVTVRELVPQRQLPACFRRALEEPDKAIRWYPPDDGCQGCALVDEHAGLATLVAAIEGHGALFGFLAVVVSRARADDPEELELVRRLAADLGHALYGIETAEARRRAEDALHESEVQFRALFERSVDGIVIADEAGRYTHANQAACELFGYPRDQLLSMSVGDLTTPAPPNATEQYAAFVDRGEQSGTFSHVRPDGEHRTVEYSAFRLGPHRYASIVRDVTRRLSLEEQLHHSQKMQAIGRLAGGIAHDFNNLLTAIVSFTMFVRRATDEGDPRLADIDQVLGATKRATSLTQQLLAFSRRQPIAPRVTDLNALISDAERLLRRTLGEDVTITTSLSDELSPVFIDPGQFDQVLMNLAINARDAMPEGGALRIVTRNVDTADGRRVSLRVTDTGCGMTEEVKAKIFEPFFTTKDETKGTGLGLSMVYGLVTQAGGTISVASEPGRGSHFEILLPPAGERSETAGARQPRDRELRGSETILVVEDEPLVRKAVVRILSRHGYTVLQARDGSEALSVFATARDEVALVLSDVVMPGMNGPETVEALRAERPSLRAVFMTGYTDDALDRRGMLDERVELITKPFTEERLVASVRRALDAGPRSRG